MNPHGYKIKLVFELRKQVDKALQNTNGINTRKIAFCPVYNNPFDVLFGHVPKHPLGFRTHTVIATNKNAYAYQFL